MMMAPHRFSLCLLCFLGGLFSVIGVPIDIMVCSSTMYWDVNAMECLICPGTNQVPDVSHVDSSGNPLSCICKSGYKKVQQGCSTNRVDVCPTFTCASCVSLGLASSRDGLRCMACATISQSGGNTTLRSASFPGSNYSSSALNAATGECACAGNFALAETNELGSILPAKRCVLCPPGTRVSTTDPYSCVRCPDPHMFVDASLNCVCQSGYTLVGVQGVGPQSCLLSSQWGKVQQAFPLSSAEKITYNDVRTSASQGEADWGGGLGVDSATSIIVRHLYPKAAVRCYFYRDPSDLPYCQALANLCALNHYDPTHTTCELFAAILRDRDGQFSHKQAGWAHTLPWLQYTGDARNTLKDVGISMKMSFNPVAEPGTFDHLSFRLRRFALNGTSLGWQPLTTQLQYCNRSQLITQQQGPQPNTRWYKFGYGFSDSYLCDLNALLHWKEPVFYELYVVDSAKAKNGLSVLYPVPVRLLNYKVSTGYTNINRKGSDWADDTLTRRFFLVDALSSVESQQPQAQPKVLRYADSVRVVVTIRDSAVQYVYPPLLEVHYSEVRLPIEPLLSQPRLWFSAEYTMDTAVFWRSAVAFFAICTVFLFFGWTLRLFNYQRRHSRGGGAGAGSVAVDTAFLGRALVYALGVFAFIYFWYLFAFSLYWLFFFKLQDRIFALLPLDRPLWGSDNDYYPFRVLLVLCFIGQFCRVCEIVVKQCGVDIFFMDWEKPRGVLGDARGGSARRRSKPVPVSVWRTILVANEWNELQTVRRTNLEFTLIALSFLLHGCGLQFLATPQPTSSDLSPGEVNIVLRFANTTLWWLLINLAERFWNWSIWERYITEPKALQFHDMCTMAKISAFILDEKYHGYYLHCRSPHAHSDANMMEISMQLMQQEDDLMLEDGLEGVPKTPQGRPMFNMFEVYVSARWRDAYDRVYSSLRRSEQQSRPVAERRAKASDRKMQKGRVPHRRLVRAAVKLNHFLCSFVDQTTPDHRRDWREQTFIHRFLRVPPEMAGVTGNSLFYGDRWAAFQNVLFLGVETDLLLFNILTYSVFELAWNNSFSAMLVTYLVEWLLCQIRGHFGHQNVASKTLVDDRFLI